MKRIKLAITGMCMIGCFGTTFAEGGGDDNEFPVGMAPGTEQNFSAAQPAVNAVTVANVDAVTQDQPPHTNMPEEPVTKTVHFEDGNIPQRTINETKTIDWQTMDIYTLFDKIEKGEIADNDLFIEQKYHISVNDEIREIIAREKKSPSNLFVFHTIKILQYRSNRFSNINAICKTLSKDVDIDLKNNPDIFKILNSLIPLFSPAPTEITDEELTRLDTATQTSLNFSDFCGADSSLTGFAKKLYEKTLDIVPEYKQIKSINLSFTLNIITLIYIDRCNISINKNNAKAVWLAFSLVTFKGFLTQTMKQTNPDLALKAIQTRNIAALFNTDHNTRTHLRDLEQWALGKLKNKLSIHPTIIKLYEVFMNLAVIDNLWGEKFN